MISFYNNMTVVISLLSIIMNNNFTVKKGNVTKTIIISPTDNLVIPQMKKKNYIWLTTSKKYSINCDQFK